MTARALTLGLVLGLGLGFSCGPPRAACSAVTCSSGCCDAAGTCQTGTLASACGSGGFACQVCAGNSSCTFGACLASGNGGSGGSSYGGGFGGSGGAGGSGGFGGSGGSGGAGGVGGSSGCIVVPAFSGAVDTTYYSPGTYLITLRQDATTMSTLEVYANMPRGGAVPGTGVLSASSPNYSVAPYSAFYADRCTGTATSCSRVFAGVGGWVDFSNLSGTADAGTVYITLSGLSLAEAALDGGGYTLIPGGACATLPSMFWWASW